MIVGRFGFHGPTEMDENFRNRSKGIIFSGYFSKGRRWQERVCSSREGKCVSSMEQSSVCAQVESSEGSAIGEVQASN